MEESEVLVLGIAVGHTSDIVADPPVYALFFRPGLEVWGELSGIGHKGLKEFFHEASGLIGHTGHPVVHVHVLTEELLKTPLLFRDFRGKIHYQLTAMSHLFRALNPQLF